MSVCDGRTPADYGFTVEGWLTGIEPATPGATVRCSNQLSYSHHGGRLAPNEDHDFKQDGRVYQPADEPADTPGQAFARSRYSPVFGFTRTRSPVPMTSGTLTVTPFSSFAGFDEAVFVAVFITGAVSTVSSTSELGRR